MAERNAPSLKTEWLKDAMKDINDLITQALSMDLQKEASSAVSSGLPKGIQQGIKKAKTTTVDLDQLIEVKMGKQNEIEKEVEEYTRILEKKTAHQQIEIPAEIVPVINKKIRTLSGNITKGIKGIDQELAKPHLADLKRRQDAFDKQIEKDPEEYKGTVFEAYNRLTKVIQGLQNADDKFLTLSDKIDEQTIKSNMDTIIDIVTLIGELSSYTKQFKDLNLPEISDKISVTGLQDYIQDFMDNFMSFPKNHPIRKKVEAAYDTGRSYGVYDIQDALYGKDVDTKIPKLLEKKLKELHKIKEEVAELEIQKIEQSLSGKITIKDLERAENALDELLEKYGDTKLESTEGFDKQVDKILDLQGKIIDTKEKLLALPQVSAASSQQSEQRITELKEEKKQAEETAEAESELLKITTDLISIGSKEHKKNDFHERLYGFNEDTGYVSEVVGGEAKEVTGEISSELFKRIAKQIKSALHTHDSDLAAIDSSDLRIFAQEIDDFGILNQYVLGFKEIQKIDLSQLSSEDIIKIANEMDNLFTRMASEWRDISNVTEAVDAGRDIDKVIKRTQNAVREYIGEYLNYLSSDSLKSIYKITDAEVKKAITESDYNEIDFTKIVSGIFNKIADKVTFDASSGLKKDEIVDDLNEIQTDIIDIIATNIQKIIFGKDVAMEGKKSADKVQKMQQQALQSVLVSNGYEDVLQTQKFVGKNIDKEKVLKNVLGDKGLSFVDTTRESEQVLDEIGNTAVNTGRKVSKSLDQITESAEEAAEKIDVVGDRISGIAYHATSANFDKFDISKSKKAQMGSGVYLTPDRNVGNFVPFNDNPNIKEAEINLEKCFILTKDYITSISDINDILKTELPDTATAEEVLNQIRQFAKKSKENSDIFRQGMLDKGYQGMYAGDYLANKNIESELVVYDENKLDKLRSFTNNELKELKEEPIGLKIEISNPPEIDQNSISLDSTLPSTLQDTQEELKEVGQAGETAGEIILGEISEVQSGLTYDQSIEKIIKRYKELQKQASITEDEFDEIIRLEEKITGELPFPPQAGRLNNNDISQYTGLSIEQIRELDGEIDKQEEKFDLSGKSLIELVAIWNKFCATLDLSEKEMREWQAVQDEMFSRGVDPTKGDLSEILLKELIAQKKAAGEIIDEYTEILNILKIIDKIGQEIQQNLGTDFIREKGFAFSTITGEHSDLSQVGNYISTAGIKQENGKYNAGLHTHPDNYIAMSIYDLYGDGTYKGDLLAFYQDWKDGLEQQFIRGLKQTLSFDSNSFFTDIVSKTGDDENKIRDVFKSIQDRVDELMTEATQHYLNSEGEIPKEERRDQYIQALQKAQEQAFNDILQNVLHLTTSFHDYAHLSDNIAFDKQWPSLFKKPQASNKTPDSSIAEELEKEASQARETAEEYQKLNDIRNDSQDITSNEKITSYTEEEIKSVKEMAEAVRNVGKTVTEDKIPPFKEEAVEVGKAIDEELNWIERLRKAISQGIPAAIDEKNDKFKEELAVVADVMESERGYLLGISTLLDEIASKARIDFKFNNNADSLEVADQADDLNNFVKTVIEWIQANNIQTLAGNSVEKGMFANLSTGYIPNSHMTGEESEFGTLAKNVMVYMAKSVGEILTAFFHTHPESIVAPSVEDIFSAAEEKEVVGVNKQFIIGTDEIDKISLDLLSPKDIEELAKIYRNKITELLVKNADAEDLSLNIFEGGFSWYMNEFIANNIDDIFEYALDPNTGEVKYPSFYDEVNKFLSDSFETIISKIDNGEKIDYNDFDTSFKEFITGIIPDIDDEKLNLLSETLTNELSRSIQDFVEESIKFPEEEIDNLWKIAFRESLDQKGISQDAYQTMHFGDVDDIDINELRQFLEIKQSSLDASNDELQTWENIRSIILSLKDDLQELLRLKSNLYSSLGYFDDSVSNEDLIDNIGSRLKELYQLRNENGFEDQFGNEIVVLKELLDSLNSSVADVTGNKNIAKYFDNANRFIEAQERLNRLNNSGASVLTGFTNEELSDVQNMIGAVDKLINELREAKGLISSTSQKDLDNTSIPSSISPEEYENLTKIQNILVEICDAIGIKNNAFLEEQNIVSSVVGSEHNDLTTLLSDLDKMSSIIDSIILAFKNINIGNNINVDWIKKFSNLKNIDFKTITSGLTSLYNAVKKLNLKDNSFLKDISNILDKGKELESLAKIISQNQSKIDKVKEASSSKNKTDIKSNYDKELNARKEILKLQHEINIAEAKGAENADEIKARNEAMADIYQAQIKEAKKLQQGNTNKNERNRIEKELRDIERRYKAEEEGERKVSEIKRAKTEQARIEKENAKAYNDAISERESLWNNLVDTIDKYQKKLNKNINEANVSKDLKQEWAGFYNQLQELGSQLGNEFNISLDTSEAQKRIAELTEDIDRSFTQNSKKAEKLVNENSVSKFYTKIADFKQRNTKLGKELTIELDQIINETRALMNGSVTGDALERKLKDLDTQFNKITASAKEAGEVGKSFGQKIKDSLTSANARFLANYLSFQDMIRYTRTVFETVRQLDTALVDLKKTTTMNNSDLEEFYQNSSNIARATGVTTQEIISQAAAWSRLGFSSKEAAETMAELSSQFAKISPGTSVEDATDYLVSTMKAFHIDFTDVESEIMDAINRIGNTMATSNSEVGEMLKRSSAAMAEANNTLAETIALESAAVQITRNAETTGTAFRTISMRIRGMDEETEEALENYEELKGKIADLTKTAKTPGGISLFTDETKTTYKSTYQLLKEIASIYHDLTDKQQAGLLEALAGKRGGQVLAGKRNCLNVQKCA